LIMRVYDKVDEFSVYKSLKLLTFYEETSMINLVDFNSRLLFITPQDSLERA
ncbi:hypothetical protein HAX54_051525, partial [Datura stramonium]|nr:hypothetical protein [Datura stramonium]